MSNTNQNAPYGLRPLKSLTGAAWSGATNLYYIPATNTDQLQPGDLVSIAGGADANGVAAIGKAVAAGPYRGVLIGTLLAAPGNPSLVGTNLNYSTQIVPATKTQAYYALVMDDQNIICSIQDDGLTALTASAVGLNASITVANPAGASQESGTVLTTSSPATTNTLPLKILGLVQEPNNGFGVYAHWLVKLNNHDLNGLTAGV